MSDGMSEAAKHRRMEEERRAEKVRKIKEKEKIERSEKAHYELEVLKKRIGQMSIALDSLIKEAHKLEKELI